MKRIIFAKNFGVLLTALIGLTACGGMSMGGFHAPAKSDSQSVTDRVYGTWASCKASTGGSTNYILKIESGDAFIDANIYPNPSCSGSKYQSYHLGYYEHKNFTAQTSTRGVAQIVLRAFYPSGDIGQSVVKIGNKFIFAAESVFETSSDNQQMTLVLNGPIGATSGELTSGALQPQALPGNVVLDLHPATHGQEIFDDLVTQTETSESQINTFQNTIETKQDVYLKASTVVGKQCLDRYFTQHFDEDRAPHSQLYPLHSSFPRHDHLKLISLGGVLNGVEYVSLQDSDFSPFIGFLFTYKMPSNNEPEFSFFVCKNQARPNALWVR